MTLEEARRIAELLDSLDFYQDAHTNLAENFTSIDYPYNLSIQLKVVRSNHDLGVSIEGEPITEVAQLEFFGNGDGYNNRINQAMIKAALAEIHCIRTELIEEINNA